MKILGIDPGLRCTGFGLIQKNGQQLAYLASGTVQTDTSMDLPQRLLVIFQGISEIVRTYGPECAAIEKVFVNVNPQSTLLLGQARGAALCALVNQQLNVAEYTALQVKQAVVGHGKAHKQQVQAMVQHLLQLPGLPGPDAADALAVAICHAHGKDSLGKLAALPGLGGKLRMKRGRLVG